MAGYSGTPLLRKLGFKPGQSALIVGLPAGLAPVFAEAPFAKVKHLKSPAALARAPAGPFDVIHLFTTDAAALSAAFPAIRARIADTGLTWISWPKKAAKVPTTVDEGLVRRLGLSAGLVDVKICAVDEVWSGLKFMVRIKDRKTPKA